jgi:hypothetical protein
MMLIMFTLLSLGARAGVVSFPLRPPAQLRSLLRLHLDGKLPADELESLELKSLDMVTVAVTALRETDRILIEEPEPVSLTRIVKTLDWVANLPIGGRLGAADREHLRAALRPFLPRAQRAKIYHQTLEMYRYYDLWDAADASYLVNEVASWRHLIDRYALLLAAWRAGDAVIQDQLARAILNAKGNPLLRFALLDELGVLPDAYYEPAFIAVRNALRPTPGYQPSTRERAERRVYLHLLERWQARYRDHDDRIARALDHVTAHSATPVEVNFVNGFRAGTLDYRPTESNLMSLDPLTLAAPDSSAASNVISLASCGRRLAGHRRTQ